MTKALKWWIAIAFVLVFFAGAALGLFAGAVHARHVVFRHGPHSGERMQQRLERELRLTPEQSSKIAPIVQSTSAELDSIRQETSARVAETMNEAHKEMLPLLTPEQRDRFEAMRRQHQEMMRRRGEGPPPGPPPD